MARIDSQPDWLGVPTKCFACGERATAYWMGTEATLSVCHTCATDKLPILIADATTFPSGPNAITNAYHTLRVLESHFWRGIAIVLSRAATAETYRTHCKKSREVVV